jgi:hypothetical protein
MKKHMTRLLKHITVSATIIAGSTLAVLASYALITVSPVSSQSAVPPAENQEILKAKAKIDPKQPFRVVLINQSKQKLEYGLTTNRRRELAPGAQVTHDRIPLPANGVIYPLSTVTAQYKQPAFEFDVSVSSNVLTVKIRQIEDGAEGDSVIRVRRDGNVFVY